MTAEVDCNDNGNPIMQQKLIEEHAAEAEEEE